MKSIPSFRLVFSIVFLLGLVLSGCNYGQPQVTEVPGRLETIVAGTIQAIPSNTPAPTNTSEPTSTSTATEPPTGTPTFTITPTATETELPPTAASLPTDTQVPEGGKIVFKQGGTTGSVEGSLDANDAVQYLLRALEGQLMIVSISSPKDQAILTVKGVQSGQVMLPKSKGWITYRTYLPSNQQYALGVSSSVATNFDLTVDVPARIRFASGATSATVTGEASSGPNISYVLRASKGQTMTVEVDSDNDQVYLATYGYDTWNELIDPDDRETQANFTLPKSEDYVVYAIQGDHLADFTLTVTIK